MLDMTQIPSQTDLASFFYSHKKQKSSSGTTTPPKEVREARGGRGFFNRIYSKSST